MSDKEFINTLKRIKTYCSDRPHCEDCMFEVDSPGCQINNLTAILAYKDPCEWDINIIKEVLEGE